MNPPPRRPWKRWLAAAGAVVLVLALTGLDRRDLDSIISKPITFLSTVTGLSFTATTTGNAFIESNNAKSCFDGSTCNNNITYNSGADVLTLNSTGRVGAIPPLSSNSTITAGLASTNTLAFSGTAASVPVGITAAGTNAGIRMSVSGTGVISAIAPFVSVVPKRLSQELHINLNTDTAFTAVGLPAPTLLAGTPTADTTDAAYQMIKFTTGAVSTNASGFSGPFTVTAASYLPMAAFVVRTDPAAVTTTRLYVGFGATPGLDQVATLAGANTIRGCWFRYDTGLSDANWFAESSDGTTASATDTTIAVAAATTYTLGIDATVSGACDFYVNGTRKVAKSTNIPAGTTALGLEASITTLAASARAFSVSKAVLQQN